MSLKSQFPRTLENMMRFQRKIPVKLEREQLDLPKRTRKVAKSSTLDALRSIYEFTDRFFTGAQSVIACSKGCSHCCHGRIWITQLEADLIADTHGLKASKVDEIMDGDVNAPRDASRPCPFLSTDGVCTIYSVRPLVCRTHFNFEPTNVLCQFDNAGKEIPMFDRHKSIPGIVTAKIETSETHGGGGGDIRRFFGESRVDVTVRAPTNI